MSVRRPVCLVCLIFLFVVYIVTGGGAPAPSWDTMSAAQKTVTVCGRVADRQEKNGSYQLYLKDVSFTSGSGSDRDQTFFPERSKGIVVKLADASHSAGNAKIGAIVEARGVFAPFEGPRCEGMFDAASYYMIRGYEGQLRRARLSAVSVRYDRISESLRHVRDRAFHILRENMSEEDAGLVAAMTLGDKSGIDTEIKELYQNAGISHVLALSGLHIASVGLAIFAFVKRIRLPEKVASVVSLSLILTYAVMTGMSISTQRALIMFGLFVMSRILGRTYDLLSAASVSALVILAFDPCFVYDTGFLLSFGAVLGIACIFPVFERIAFLLSAGFKKGRIITKIGQGVGISLSITAATLPVLGRSFMRISVCSVVINLVVIPLMGLVLLTGFVGITVGFCGLDPGPIFTITHYILWVFGTLGKFFEKIRGNILTIGRPERWQIITYGIIVITAVITSNIAPDIINLITHPNKSVDPTGLRYTNNTASYGKIRENKISYDIINCARRQKVHRLNLVNSTITAVMIIASSLVLFIHPRKDLEIRNVDVGQGDCALITGDDIPAVMIDGGSSDIKEVADNRIIPVLRSNRVPVIDWCFLTHMDSDHVNGVIGLLENDTSGIYIERLVVSGASLSDSADGENVSRLLAAAKRRGTDVITMSAGDVLRLNGARIICLSPAKESILRRTSGSSNTDENDNSLVLRLEYKGFSALFTGDIGEEVEKTIAGNIGDCDYLKVAHHGSRNSTSGDFLKRADPELSVISAGVNNSYGHPHKETVERLKGTGTRIYTTADDGEVIMTVDERIVRVVTMVGNGSK